MWIVLALISALCLGVYDVSKKRALSQLDVVQVLTWSVCISSLLLLPELLYSRLGRTPDANSLFYVPTLGWEEHMKILLKSLIVLSSWVFAYISVKYLPLSVVSPMQATRPMWTLLGAVTIFGEHLNGWQWLGITLALGSLFAFSFAERRSAQRESVNGVAKYYVCLALAILIGACSGLYDKYMMRHLDHNAVQVWYTIYQALMMLVVYAVINYRKPSAERYHRLSGASLAAVTMISLFLVLSDYVYFVALSDPNSLIAVVSTIRRGGTVIPFLYGLIWLKEKDATRKILCLIGVLAGLICLILN